MMEVEKFRDGLKNELRISKGAGELVENEADPISFDMFEQMCTYAVNVGNAFFCGHMVLSNGHAWHGVKTLMIYRFEAQALSGMLLKLNSM